MSSDVVVIFTFAAVALAILSVVKLMADTLFRHQEEIDERFKEAFRDEMRERAQQSSLFKDLQQLAVETSLPRPTLSRRIQMRLDQSGLGITLSRLLLINSVVGLTTLVAMLLATGNLLQSGLVAVAGFCIPAGYVEYCRKRRIRRLCDQLPDAFDMMARALRAGQTITSAFQLVANDCRGPVSEEFAYCYEQQHLGIPQEVALRDLASRTGVMELHIVVVAMIVQRKSGGNLAELLSKMADLVRKRVQLNARVRTLTGEGRMQANMLIALPPIACLAIFWVNRDYASILIANTYLLYTAVALQTVGVLTIRKLLSFSSI